jgi:aminoglycoside 6'-N-acetyltransferase I
MKMLPYYPVSLSRCCDIYVAAFTAPPLGFDFLNKEKARRYLRDIAKMPGFRGFVVECDGQVVAFIFGRLDDYFEGTVFTVEEFAVLPAFQRGGVGTRAMEMLETELAGMGVHAVSLQTSRDMPAYQFYLKNGYTEETKSATLVKPLLPVS